MTTCPACGQRAIGKVGIDQYFCWDCCVEFVVRDQHIKIYNVEADGTLTLHVDPSEDTIASLQLQKG